MLAILIFYTGFLVGNLLTVLFSLFSQTSHQSFSYPNCKKTFWRAISSYFLPFSSHYLIKYHLKQNHKAYLECLMGLLFLFTYKGYFSATELYLLSLSLLLSRFDLQEMQYPFVIWLVSFIGQIFFLHSIFYA